MRTGKKEKLAQSIFNFRRRVNNHVAVPLALLVLGISMLSQTAISAPKTLKITQLYTTAETTTSAAVVWNTSIAADSLVQYSNTNPVPAHAAQVYLPAQVTLHDIQLGGLEPGTLYYFKVTSCAKRACTTASGSFETFPICPDVVPPVSGFWQEAISPNTAGGANNQLLGISAVAANDVWAVGWARHPTGPSYAKQTLIEHFDGNLWSIVQNPNGSTDIESVLHSVSAVSANDVWAVGSSNSGSLPSRTLIQHWDGVSWKIVPSPSPDSQINELRGVAALSTNNAWAVGHRGGTRNATPTETLILHWNGTSWTQVASPNVAGGGNQLFGITALASNNIWAVGAAGSSPLTLHWDGSTWRVVPIRIGGGLSTERLNAISGTTSNNVWAVGEGTGIFTNQKFATIRHWDGANWTEKICRATSSSNPPTDYEGGGPSAYFTGVAAVSGEDVWAVGVRGSGPMILHWDGQAWTAVTHPRASPDSASLRAVAAASGGRAWAAGVKFDVTSTSVTQERTLIHSFNP